MKALILVGGFGTRLRPLTFSVPKPLVELANKPIVAHQIEALVKVGVTEIILAIAYRPELMMEYVKKFEEQYKVKITCSQEVEPLGTAGPIRLAKEIIEKDNTEDLFFVFNSDVICEFPLQKLIDFHKAHGKEGSILLSKVEDPSKYGVVITEEDGKIKSFVEKPKEFIGDRINAGLYLFKTSIIKRIEPKPTSIEREIFPVMAKEGELYAQNLDGFWMDVGQPKDFIIGSQLYLDSLKKSGEGELAKGDNIIGNVLIDPSAKVHPEAVLGPNVSIGADCVIGKGVRLQNTCVFKGVTIQDYAWIKGSVIGWQSNVGKWVRIDGLSVLAEDVTVKDEVYINGCSILPHKAITANLAEAGAVIM